MKEKPPIIALNQVSKRFRVGRGNPIQVLKDVDLFVEEGEIVALLGPSGCGKTTTLKIMAGLMSPSEGSVVSQGKPLSGVNSDLALVFQNYALLPWFTVEENVAIGLQRLSLTAKKARKRVEESIDLVGLGGFEEAYPKELSGGMRQRVGIARALAVRPALLCLDEPFSAVDVLTAEHMRAEVIDLWKDTPKTMKSVALVTHDIVEAAEMAQRIYVFGSEPGHIRAVVENLLPYPRDTNDRKLKAVVDRIHAILTEALIPEEEERQTSSHPSWYQSLENLPNVNPSEIVGLLEVLDDNGGKMDIFKLATEVEMEFGHSLAVTKTAEILDLVETPKQNVIFTELGKQLMEEDSTGRKELFSEQVRKLHVFQTLLTWVEEAEDKEIDRETVLERLMSYFPNERLDRLFDTLVSFGRYAEILSFDANSEVLGLPEEEEEPEAEREAEGSDPPQAGD